MQLGVHIPNFNFAGGTEAIAGELIRMAKTAEAGGATWLSFMDHYFQIDWMAPAEHPMLEGYSALGFLAAHTSSVTLGLLVTGVTYRHPGLLAKVVSTLDVLSGGRAALDVGAAWYEREHRGLGVPLESVQLLRVYRELFLFCSTSASISFRNSRAGSLPDCSKSSS